MIDISYNEWMKFILMCLMGHSNNMWHFKGMGSKKCHTTKKCHVLFEWPLRKQAQINPN